MSMLVPFHEHASLLFAGSAAPIHTSLDEFYRGFNGGYFWGRALLIRPGTSLGSSPRSVREWNERALWKARYEGACDDILFFAEDAFGVQFGVRGGCVVQFDPETAAIATVSNSLHDWIELILRDAPVQTGAPVLNAWESAHGNLEPGYRLVATGAGGHQNHRNHRRPHARRWCRARIFATAKCARARKRDVGVVAADVRARVSPARG